MSAPWVDTYARTRPRARPRSPYVCARRSARGNRRRLRSSRWTPSVGRLRVAPVEALQPLRDPAYRRLAGSYAVNALGDYVGLVALSVLVYARTHSPYATAAL